MNRSSSFRKPLSTFALTRSDDGGKRPSADKIRVLIADDHTTVLAGLASIIDMEPDMIVVAEATNGRQAVDLWQKHCPDVTLLELRMPNLDGVGVIDEIRQQDSSARVIMLTTYDADNDIYRAIKAGAKGYLLKDARREELLDCIRKVSRGETCIPQALVEKLAAGMSSETLTGRELGVLTLLARGKSNKEIGANLFISETTVNGHLRNIFTKLTSSVARMPSPSQAAVDWSSYSGLPIGLLQKDKRTNRSKQSKTERENKNLFSPGFLLRSVEDPQVSFRSLSYSSWGPIQNQRYPSGTATASARWPLPKHTRQ